MYSKVVYDYFNSNPKMFKCKPNKLIRKNAFKKKTTKKTILAPKSSNISNKKLISSSPNKDATPKLIPNMENSSVNVVYDTVQCIWKYAKSFVSNRNSDAGRFQDHLRKKNKCRSSRRNIKLESLRRSIWFNALPSNVSDNIEKSCEPIKSNNEKINTETLPQEIEDATMEEENRNDFSTIENLETSTNLQHFDDPEKQSVFKELDETLISTNYDQITSKETQSLKQDDKNVSLPMSVNKNQDKNKITEVYIKQQDLQNNKQGEPENVNIAVQILKSSIKTYGRGKRKNKKLHVHFKDECDNEQRNYSAYTLNKFRKSDCYHPNAFYKKFKIRPIPERKKNTHCLGVKKIRTAFCTKPFLKRSTRNSSSNISLQTKSSDSCENRAGKKARKAPKKYPVYTTTKIYKRKRAKNNKKVIVNKKNIKTVQNIMKTIADTKCDKPINISHNDASELMKAINIGDEPNSSQQSMLLPQAITAEDNNLFGINYNIFELNHLSEELKEFIEFINNE